jgi:hypothetical protein
LWHIDPLLGNNCEANSETTAIAKQHLHKFTTVLELLLGSDLHIIMEVGIFYGSTLRLYHSTNQDQVVKPIFSSERMLHKDYYHKSSVGKKISGHGPQEA